jgi:hypothetical protein
MGFHRRAKLLQRPSRRPETFDDPARLGGFSAGRLGGQALWLAFPRPPTRAILSAAAQTAATAEPEGIRSGAMSLVKISCSASSGSRNVLAIVLPQTR